MTAEKKLKALCYSPDIPGHVKRHFAADCAERAMFAWCDKTSKEPFPQWWDLMEAIRDYAEGRITMDALQETREAYRTADLAADLANNSAACSAANRAAYWAAERAAERAAEGAADWGADSGAEREWQLRHFRALIEQYAAMKARLVLVLNRRAEEVAQTLPQIQQGYEEVLFV